MAKTDVSAWLRGETPKHLELLTRLRDTLTASLAPQQEVDGDGKVTWTPADLNEAGTPTRDWCRAYAQYRGGYEMLLQEERERARLLVMAQSKGQQPMTDDEYERELRQLGLDAVKEMDDAAIAAEIARRGLTSQQLIVSVGHEED